MEAVVKHLIPCTSGDEYDALTTQARPANHFARVQRAKGLYMSIAELQPEHKRGIQ